MSSSWFLTGCCEKNFHQGGNGAKGGKFALASGEEANNRQKAREVQLSHSLLVIFLWFFSDPVTFTKIRNVKFLGLCSKNDPSQRMFLIRIKTMALTWKEKCEKRGVTSHFSGGKSDNRKTILVKHVDEIRYVFENVPIFRGVRNQHKKTSFARNLLMMNAKKGCWKSWRFCRRSRSKRITDSFCSSSISSVYEYRYTKRQNFHIYIFGPIAT